MAASGPVLLAPFGPGKEADWFRQAYKWKKAKILSWMDEVTQRKAGGPPDAATAVVLKKIYDKIIQLVHPNGSMYNAVPPGSHIARKLNAPAWGNGQNLTISKFILLSWPCSQDKPPATPSPTPTPGSPRVPGWWCLYDLLGLFLSLLGPAPETANKNNYFLPMTAVYARWCTRLAGRAPGGWKWRPSPPGAGHWPFMFQCTWHRQKDAVESLKHLHPFFLGASTGGDAFTDSGTWRVEVQRSRFNMLFNSQKKTLVLQSNFVPPPPNPSPMQKAPVPYGNCAETYPFVAMVSANDNWNQSLNGLALRRDFTSEKEEPEYNGLSTGEIWTNLVGPCGKCTKLILKAGATLSNFHEDSEKEPPPKPSPSDITHDINGISVTEKGLDMADYPSTKEGQSVVVN